MIKKSITDVAFECMKRKRREVPFAKLWQEVIIASGFDEDTAKKKVAQFYNAITLDSRFVSLPDNKWDLKSRHTFNETRIDTSAILMDDELDDDLDEEKELDEEFGDELDRDNQSEY